MLIRFQKPDATRVAGYRTWKRLGRWVRRGEHGIAILAPIVVKRRRDEEDEDVGELPEERIVVSFRPVYVFDISQTDGAPLPEPPMHRLTTSTERGEWLYGKLLGIAQKNGITVRTGTDLGRAYGVYYPQEHAIALAAGMARDEEAKVLCHELAHALLHRDNSRTGGEREAEAEGVAFVVSTYAGLGTESNDDSFSYIAGWARRHDGVALLKRVAATIQRTAAGIMEQLDDTQADAEDGVAVYG